MHYFSNLFDEVICIRKILEKNGNTM